MEIRHTYETVFNCDALNVHTKLRNTYGEYLSYDTWMNT